MRTRLGLVALIACATTLAGCGAEVPQVQGTEGSAPTASTEPEVKGPSADDIEAYFKSVADSDPSEMEEALKLAAPGSIAELYLKHQIAGANAIVDGGGTNTADDLTKKGDGYESCSGSGKDEVCTTWADVQAKGDKIADFTVNGRSLAGRILAGNRKVFRFGRLGTVQVVSAYKTGANDLSVALKVKSADKTISMDSTTSYRTKQGRQINNQGANGPSELRPNSLAYYLVSFKNADLGGDLHVEFFTPEGNFDSGTVDIALK